MTIVDHSRDHELAVQGNQAACAWALRHLLEDASLPAVTWVVGDINERLTGMAFRDVLNPAAKTQRQVVEEWAAYLHSPIAETVRTGMPEISAQGWAYGVRVRICARLWATSPREAA